MANKNFNTRIVNKHDTEENWSKANGFIPLEGEVVIYESDETHITPRLKIGDGKTNVNNLPFVSGSTTDENYYTKTEVDEAVNGRVPRKQLTDLGAPFDSVIAVDNSDYNQGDADGNGSGMPNDSSYYYINVIGDDIGKNIDNYLSVFKNSIPRRDSKGNLFTGTPIDDEDCVNKKYVDDKVAAISGGGGVTVDQTYNPESGNAQSGVAVAEAVSSKADIIEVNQIKDDIAYKLDYKNPQKLTTDQQLAIQSAIGILSVKEVLF